MSDFKKCSNGHYYDSTLARCPYCPGGNSNANNADSTVGQFSSFSEGGGKTEVYGGFNESSTRPDETTVTDKTKKYPNMPERASNKTEFGTEFVTEFGDGQKVVQRVYRITRKLVGWLVTYTVDRMGVDFRLYEGRNLIGRDMECNITINDGMMSAKHATILFRDNNYALKDEMSSHGTFVNDESIGFEPYMLKDGDVIRMGETIFKFRTSL